MSMKTVAKLLIVLITIFPIYLFAPSKQVFETRGLKIVQGMENSGGCVFVYFSSILYETQRKKISVPIFQGTLEEIDYKKELHHIAKKQKMAIVENLCIPLERGKVKETFFELVNFYKKSLLKNTDIEHPTAIDINTEVKVWEVWYDFDYEGIHGTMGLYIPGAFNKKEFLELYNEKWKAKQSIESIHEILFDEKSKLH
ncbi:MAG: hypothetical protein IT569_07185, partial [Leptospiraceae bacterium]|nr:hypothetical protein [Leptospiraceae bacterium]